RLGLLLDEPVGHRLQPTRVRFESAHLLLCLLFTRLDDARDNRLLVHIESASNFVHYVHGSLLRGGRDAARSVQPVLRPRGALCGTSALRGSVSPSGALTPLGGSTSPGTSRLVLLARALLSPVSSPVLSAA